MKAIRIHTHGNTDVLKIDKIDLPICKDNEVKIKIKACSLNHLDIWVRNGLPGLPISLPLILGSDGSGTIIEIGKNIKKYSIGDDVVIQPGTFDKTSKSVMRGKENYSKSYGILGETQDGVQAEYVCMKSKNIHCKPDSTHPNNQMTYLLQTLFLYLIYFA